MAAATRAGADPDGQIGVPDRALLAVSHGREPAMDSSVSPQEHPTDAELLAAAAGVLGKLRFTPEMPRDAKWRTTDQLARELGLDPADVARLDRVLCEHEALVLERLKQGRPAEAVIRRAKYPDRTTALPLWGSTALHGPPWTGQQPERTDPPEDISPSLRTAQGALSAGSAKPG